MIVTHLLKGSHELDLKLRSHKGLMSEAERTDGGGTLPTSTLLYKFLIIARDSARVFKKLAEGETEGGG